VDKEVNARGGEGRIWRGRRFTKGIILREILGLFFGVLLDLQRGELSFGVGRFSTGTGLLEVLGTGARISI
jgi:hypothetical protein